MDTSDLDLEGVLRVLLENVEKRQAEVPAQEEDDIVRARAEFKLSGFSSEEVALKLASACVAGMQAAKRILSLSDAEAVDIFADFEPGAHYGGVSFHPITQREYEASL